MKDRRGSSVGGGGDRFAVFPFSMGCMSQSAVSVADPCSDKKAQVDPSSSSSSAAAVATVTRAGSRSSSEEGAGAGEATKEKQSVTPPAGLVAAGVSRLMKGIRQMFAAFDGDEEEEEEEREMVIGYPTDVQHVGHIGWDGGHSNNAMAVAGMVNAFSSLRHLDMAAAAHASA